MNNSFKQLNEFYDQIYVLSIKAAAERRLLFSERFMGLNYSFFFGADKNEFTEAELIEKNIYSRELTRKHHRYSKTMRQGEIACSWSHKMIYEDMIANNYRNILVFEDDAVPNEAMLPHIPAILNELPADAELLMWGWAKNGEYDLGSQFKTLVYRFQNKIGRLKWNQTMIGNLHAKPHSTFLKKAGFHDYTYAYAITLEAAKKLVNMQTPIQYLADNLLAHAATNNLVNSYISYPTTFLHDNLPDGRARDSFIR